MESKPKPELIRVTYYEGEVGLDTTGRAKGRGAYICRDAECLKKAIKKKAFARAFEREVTKEQEEQLIAQLAGELNDNGQS